MRSTNVETMTPAVHNRSRGLTGHSRRPHRPRLCPRPQRPWHSRRRRDRRTAALGAQRDAPRPWERSGRHVYGSTARARHAPCDMLAECCGLCGPRPAATGSPGQRSTSAGSTAAPLSRCLLCLADSVWIAIIHATTDRAPAPRPHPHGRVPPRRGAKGAPCRGYVIRYDCGVPNTMLSTFFDRYTRAAQDASNRTRIALNLTILTVHF